jgi:hypothetical protein
VIISSPGISNLYSRKIYGKFMLGAKDLGGKAEYKSVRNKQERKFNDPEVRIE